MTSFNCWLIPFIHLNSPFNFSSHSHSPFLPRTEDHQAIMSHRRSFSQGNVPFSWEEKPGVSKFNHQKIPSATDVVPDKHEFLDLGKPLLPPPPPSAAPITPGRRTSSSSLKGMIRDDPFMVAFVKCTKNQNSKTMGDHHHHHYHQRKKSSCSVGLSSKKGRLLLFCKNAFADVEVDNLMKYSNLPPLPGHKDSIRLHR